MGKRAAGVSGWRAHAERRKFKRSSVLEQLTVERNRWAIALAATVAVSSAAVAIDLLTFPSGASDRGHAASLAFSLAYGVFASVAVTFAVYLYLAQITLRSQINKGHAALDLLGIDSTSATSRVAIILPTFPFQSADGVYFPEVEQQIDQGRSVVESQVHELGWSIPRSVLKALPDIGASAHSRRDMLLLNDLVRLLAASGLPHPIVVSDMAFIKMIARAGDSPDGVIRIRMGQSDDTAPQVDVGSVIVVGLFSNLVTTYLEEYGNSLFQLRGGAKVADRKILLRDEHTDNFSLVSTVDQADSGDKYPTHKDAYALLSRLFYRNLTVGIVGGLDALGTARIGDFLTDLPPAARELAKSIDRDADYCAVVECPGSGNRWGAYGVRSKHSMTGWASKLIKGLPLPVHLKATVLPPPEIEHPAEAEPHEDR